MAGEPEILKTLDSVLWKVPIFLAYPSKGVVGKAGDYFVDAATGDIVSVTTKEALMRNVEALLKTAVKWNLDELKRDILNGLFQNFRGAIEGVVLFGSVARGEARRKSDVDVLVFTGDDGLVRFERDLRAYLALKPVRAKYKVDMTVITLNLKEAFDITPPLMNIASDGVALFDSGGKVRSFLSAVKGAVEQAGFVRYKVGNAYGWKTSKLKKGENIALRLKADGPPRRS
jgi:predicted nucleotidyltransferase